MNDKQREALRILCERYGVPFDEERFFSRFDLPEGYVAGWVGPIFVGVSPEGEINS